MNLKSVDYELPKELIAKNPASPRDSSSLVEVKESFEIYKFTYLINLLKKGDCLVINNTKVVPAQLSGICKGKKISLTLNNIISKNPTVKWTAFCKPIKKIEKNLKINFSKNFDAKIEEIKRDHNLPYLIINFNCNYEDFLKKIKRFGKIALPPYITKIRNFEVSDNKDYQTIFSKIFGAVASPTASLHFSTPLKNKLIKKGVKIVFVTLHVNGGTFLPINTENFNNHKMHIEYGEIPKKTSNLINKLRSNGGKIIAVGTTVLRILESSKDKNGKVLPFKGNTNIFIKPGWKVNTIDALITNFHTPRSTLLLILHALIGESITRKLYEFAIKKKLRFLSYGDACLIWIKNG